MKTIVIIGSSGMAGHVLTMKLRETALFNVIDIGPRREVFPETQLINLKVEHVLHDFLMKIKPDVIINCVGMLIKDAENSPNNAIWYNSYFPHLLSLICSESGGKLIHLSTDCVFSGMNGPYAENDYRNGDSVYDRTKALGEIINKRDLTIRTSITGPDLKEDGSGLFHWFMQQKGSVYGFKKALWSGIMTTELARFINFILTEEIQLNGLIHLSVEGGINKYDLLNLFKKEFSKEISIIAQDKHVIDKRLVPSAFNIGFEIKNYADQIHEMKEWIDKNKKTYSYKQDY